MLLREGNLLPQFEPSNTGAKQILKTKREKYTVLVEKAGEIGVEGGGGLNTS